MRHGLTPITLLAGTLLVSIELWAQAPSPAWFGVPVPAGLSDPHRPILDVSSATPAPAVVPAGEQNSRDLAGATIRKDLEAIVGIAQADRARGERAWGRITGFRGADETHAWVLQQFQAAGLRKIETQTYTATQSTGIRGTGRSNCARVTRWLRRARRGSRVGVSDERIAARRGAVIAPLVFVGATTDAALPDVDVKNKVAVQTLHPQAGAYSERTRTTERARELGKRGALAVLNVVEQAGNMHVRDFSNCGVPVSISALTMADSSTGVLDRANARGAADRRAWKSASPRKRSPASKDTTRLARSRGRRVDEMVIVNAHADGWFDAAGDNGDGLAVLVALARHFVKPQHQPERTLLFVASGGHHGSGMNGPGNLVTMNAQLRSKVVLVLNLEHIAQLQFRNDPFRVEPGRAADGIRDLERGAGDCRHRQARMQRYGFALRPTFSSSIAGDLGGYAPLGVPRVQAIHSGPMYRTSGDTLDTISTPGLERAARFYAYFITEVAKSDRTALQALR